MQVVLNLGDRPAEAPAPARARVILSTLPDPAPVAAALIQRLSPMLGLRPDGLELPVIEPRPADAVKVSAK